MKNIFENAWLKPERKKEDEQDLTQKETGEEISSKEIPDTDNEKAIEIAKKTKDYEIIIEQLKHKDLWENQLIRVHEKFNSRINKEDFPTKEALVWEMLTVLYLYDEETANHCVETYRLLKERVKNVMTDNLFLAKIMEKEDHEMEDIYFAAITHDIGKICLPEFLINNTLKKNDWNDLLLGMIRNGELDDITKKKLGVEDFDNYTDTQIIEILEAKNLRAKDFVPVEKGISSDEKKQLETLGFSGKEPFMEIMNEHEKYSGTIHAQKGLSSTEKLVGQHHHNGNGNDTVLPSPKHLDTSNDISTILHLADFEQALKSKRSYKGPFSDLKILQKLIEEAEGKYPGQTTPYLWIKGKRDAFLKEGPRDLKSLSDEEVRSLQIIEDYLDKNNAINLKTFE